MFLGHQIGSFLGVWAGGAVYDATGSYAVVWIAAAALGLIAALVCLPIDEAAVPVPRPAGDVLYRRN